MADELIIYTQNGCIYSDMMKQWFKDNQIPFIERNISLDPEFRRILTQDLKQIATPVMVMGEDIKVGYDRDFLNKLLE